MDEPKLIVQCVRCAYQANVHVDELEAFAECPTCNYPTVLESGLSIFGFLSQKAIES